MTGLSPEAITISLQAIRFVLYGEPMTADPASLEKTFCTIEAIRRQLKQRPPQDCPDKSVYRGMTIALAKIMFFQNSKKRIIKQHYLHLVNAEKTLLEWSSLDFWETFKRDVVSEALSILGEPSPA